MKKNILFISILMHTLVMIGQNSPKEVTFSIDQNYILSRIYTEKGGTKFLDRVDYFDGLGRPIETVQVGVSPKKADLITYQEYDYYGRESNLWLPVVKANNKGAFINLNDFKTASDATYSSLGETQAYSHPIYEPSPLNRVVEQYGPGQDWHQDYSASKGKAVRTAYKTNIVANTQLNCIMYKATGTNENPVLSKGSNYATGELYVTEIKDEDNNISYEFKDKLGQVVLTRQISNSVNHDTYYVYNDFGNLCFVLPPLTEGNVAVDNLNKYGYQYKYDHRNRCTWKKLPGAEPIYYVYDKADRLIFTQDGEQRAKGEWVFSIPDAFRRMILTGSCTTVNNAEITTGRFNDWLIKASYTGDGGHFGYDIKVHKDTYSAHLSIENKKIYSVNYYDSYNFLTKTNIPIPNTDGGYTTPEAGYGVKYDNAKGLLTGTLTAQMLSGGGLSTTYLYSVMYYDNRGRIIQTKSNNHLEGFEKEYIAYNFVGQPIKRKHEHKVMTLKSGSTSKTATTQTEIYDYAYDHAGRLTETKHNGVIIASNSYDELGRLGSNKKGNNASLDTKYTYNIRSWTTSMMSHHLHFNLSYTHSGNIKTQAWTQEAKIRKYDFAYDGLSRLLSAKYTSPVAGEKYGVTYSYDKHGNIASINREGKTAGGYAEVDKLSMTYSGNQLTQVRDGITSASISGSADFINYGGASAIMAYNKNGALSKDTHKGITEIKYNSLNLPQSMAIDNISSGGMARGKIDYTYSASGVKLKTIHTEDQMAARSPVVGINTYASGASIVTQTDYVGNKIYENGTLKRTLIDGGYIEGGAYHYYLTDHLGNNRAVFTGAGQLVQRTQYYPFGMAFADKQGEQLQPYKYNGKELDTRLQLNTYDYAARYMDPAIGRFTSIDPLAEKKTWMSPYVYCSNNSINRIDPDGRDDYFSEIGKYLGNDNSNTDFIKVMNQKDWDLNKINNNTIDPQKGEQLSELIRKSKISDKASLNIYNHYNPTNLSLKVTKDNKTMAFVRDIAQGVTLTTKIEVNLRIMNRYRYSDKISEVENIFAHEEKHYDDYRSMGINYDKMPTQIRELRAIKVQISHDSWKKVSDEFRRHIVSYADDLKILVPGLNVNVIPTKTSLVIPNKIVK